MTLELKTKLLLNIQNKYHNSVPPLVFKTGHNIVKLNINGKKASRERKRIQKLRITMHMWLSLAQTNVIFLVSSTQRRNVFLFHFRSVSYSDLVTHKQSIFKKKNQIDRSIIELAYYYCFGFFF